MRIIYFFLWNWNLAVASVFADKQNMFSSEITFISKLIYIALVQLAGMAFIMMMKRGKK